ncbi:hypothetical protein ID0090_03780 [Helicobacter pylori]
MSFSEHEKLEAMLYRTEQMIISVLALSKKKNDSFLYCAFNLTLSARRIRKRLKKGNDDIL